MHAMHPTLLVGPADWDAARMPRDEFLARATALWRARPAACGRHRLRRPRAARRACLSHRLHAQARSRAGADPARGRAAAAGRRRRQHAAGGKAAHLHREPPPAAQCRRDGRAMGARAERRRPARADRRRRHALPAAPARSSSDGRSRGQDRGQDRRARDADAPQERARARGRCARPARRSARR